MQVSTRHQPPFCAEHYRGVSLRPFTCDLWRWRAEAARCWPEVGCRSGPERRPSRSPPGDCWPLPQRALCREGTAEGEGTTQTHHACLCWAQSPQPPCGAQVGILGGGDTCTPEVAPGGTVMMTTITPSTSRSSERVSNTVGGIAGFCLHFYNFRFIQGSSAYKYCARRRWTRR